MILAFTTPELHIYPLGHTIQNHRFGRKAIKRDRSPFFRFWLIATVRHSAIYTGLTPGSGNLTR